MSREFFEQVSDQLAAFLPPSRRRFTVRRGSRNLKLWYGEEPREHFEVQLLKVRGKTVLEVGFHAEHSSAARNDEVLASLDKKRKELGKDVESGPFLGPQGRVWRRLSEIWDGSDLLTPETATEAANRLARYIEVLRP